MVDANGQQHCWVVPGLEKCFALGGGQAPRIAQATRAGKIRPLTCEVGELGWESPEDYQGEREGGRGCGRSRRRRATIECATWRAEG
jgi:hypothetical protein